MVKNKLLGKKLQKIKIEIDGEEVELNIVQPSFALMQSLPKGDKEEDKTEANKMLIKECVVDENGEQLLSMEEVGQMDYEVILNLMDKLNSTLFNKKKVKRGR